MLKQQNQVHQLPVLHKLSLNIQTPQFSPSLGPQYEKLTQTQEELKYKLLGDQKIKISAGTKSDPLLP